MVSIRERENYNYGWDLYIYVCMGKQSVTLTYPRPCPGHVLAGLSDTDWLNHISKCKFLILQRAGSLVLAPLVCICIESLISISLHIYSNMSSSALSSTIPNMTKIYAWPPPSAPSLSLFHAQTTLLLMLYAYVACAPSYLGMRVGTYPIHERNIYIYIIYTKHCHTYHAR